MAAQKKVNQIIHLPQQQPQKEQSPSRVIKRRLEPVRKRSFYSFKLLFAICGIGVFCLMFLQLYLDSHINHINAQAEMTRMQVNQELSINEQLASQVSALSRPTRIMGIASEQGLTFNDNVVRIRR